ncbi:cyclodeaminase [Thermoactinomyces sp. CICC 10523]|jgi:ectoine utilization protein EutC|uniref:cyclodeaminase n=1 Tax=Thermoactinomyces sp. CICC 10523 TaxID=2767428 RepID=UPI0018DB893F|nr:cyclodeaminase [Thermoactinomyces sp. CICC 10523]MBH8596498.1 cyclodeaminase [Thermoactinomyces sp. CICC 10523]
MIIFHEREIREVVQINNRAIAVVEEGFTSLATQKVAMPPIMRVDVPENNGEVDVKTAYIPGWDQFAIKVSSGFFNNYQKGLPSLSGMMLLMNTETGIPEAVLLDNGYLTDVRTAAAGAIAAKYLARENPDTVGVIGAGAQARYQMMALKQVRNFKRIMVYGPTQSRVEQYAKEMEEMLGVKVKIARSPEEVVKESEVVVTTTPSRSPVIKAEWLHPGLHITAMGSDAEHKQELEASVFSQADLLVCDVKSQCFRLGELHHGLEQGTISRESEIVELAEITSGMKSGRTDERQITVCDLTGTGVQDTAIAVFAYDQLSARGLGMRFD